MLKRTLVFSNPYHLAAKMEQVVATCKCTGETRRIPAEDIGFVLFENREITFTQSVIALFNKNKTAVIFCNNKHLPDSMLLNLDSNQIQTERFKFQIEAKLPLRKNLWKQTIIHKIKNQADLLRIVEKKHEPLLQFATMVKSGDSENVEAKAARYYWNELFDISNFKREREGIAPNNLLNYGYIILRAAVARALSSSGLLPSLGIHHKNRYNSFCLADDIMEPYRPFVDWVVWKIASQETNIHVLDTTRKTRLLSVLTHDVRWKNKTSPLMVAISTTTASLARSFETGKCHLAYPLLCD